jgi:hypothetical protein
MPAANAGCGKGNAAQKNYEGGLFPQRYSHILTIAVRPPYA